jgi:REP element-mobilizing transposase RayT
MGSPALPERKRLFHTSPFWIGSSETFFITICCAKRGSNQLAEPVIFAVMTGALVHQVKASKLWVHLFLAMPDHLHALIVVHPDQKMEKVIRDWKRFVARQAKVVWQDGFFDHRLRREESFEQKARYIRMNPVRAGLVSESGAWNYVWPPNDAAAAR